MLFAVLLYRAVRTVELPTTLEDFYQLRYRQEGHVCELRNRSVHGYIAVPTSSERLFFQESLSGIPRKETNNIRMNTKVQFSVDKNEQGFFAKDLFIKVRTLISLNKTKVHVSWPSILFTRIASKIATTKRNLIDFLFVFSFYVFL